MQDNNKLCPRENPVAMVELAQDEKAYLGSDLQTETVVARCLDLLKQCGQSAHAEWTDPSLTSTSQNFCLAVTVEGGGTYYGYGSTKDLAAISCFKNLWNYYVVVPNAPSPNAKELSLKESGNTLGAIRAYMDRTDESLGVARRRLEI